MKFYLFRKLHTPPEKSKAFFLTLVKGVLSNRKALDTIIEDYSSNWKISRMPCVDRNILRIAMYEILAMEDIPAKVSINEAIDIGKKYGTQDSGAFINGILDGIHQAFDQDLITFKPLEAGDWNDVTDNTGMDQSRQGPGDPSYRKNEMASEKISHRLVRLGPGVRKRMTVQPKGPLKQSGE